MIRSNAAKFGCEAATLRVGVRRREKVLGQRRGVSTAAQYRINQLECEVRERRQANEMLLKASAYFAQAKLDRRLKP